MGQLMSFHFSDVCANIYNENKYSLMYVHSIKFSSFSFLFMFCLKKYCINEIIDDHSMSLICNLINDDYCVERNVTCSKWERELFTRMNKKANAEKSYASKRVLYKSQSFAETTESQ